MGTTQYSFNREDRTEATIRQLEDIARRLKREQLVLVDHQFSMDQELVDVSMFGGQRSHVPGVRRYRLEVELTTGPNAGV